MIEFKKLITREYARANPDKLFVFGDNTENWGLGGQAKELRGEPNAVGIPTKVSPKLYYDDEWFIHWEVKALQIFKRLAAFEGTIVWPSDGIGTGLAKLEQKAPLIWKRLKELEKELFSGKNRKV